RPPFFLSCCLRVSLDLVTNIPVCIQTNVLHRLRHHCTASVQRHCPTSLHPASRKTTTFATHLNVSNSLYLHHPLFKMFSYVSACLVPRELSSNLILLNFLIQCLPIKPP